MLVHISKKRSSSGGTSSSPKRQVKQSTNSSADPGPPVPPDPAPDMPANVDDMMEILSSLHNQQRSRRRSSGSNTVARVLKTNNLQALFKVLLEGATATEQDLLEAIHHCQVDVVELLLKATEIALTRFDRGFTFLHEVAAINRADLVNVVVSAIDKVQIAWGGKVAVNLIDNHRRTALHIAAETGSLDALQALLSAGASLEARDKDGNTPLLWCTASDNATNVRTALFLIRQVSKAKSDYHALHYLNLCETVAREPMCLRPIKWVVILCFGQLTMDTFICRRSC